MPPNASNEELSLRPPPNSIIKRMPPMPFKGNTFGPSMNDTGRMNQPSPPHPIMSPLSEPIALENNKNASDKKKKEKVNFACKFKKVADPLFVVSVKISTF